MGLTGWGKEIRRWYHQDIAYAKRAHRPSRIPVWSLMISQEKQILNVSEYVPYKNKTPGQMPPVPAIWLNLREDFFALTAMNDCSDERNRKMYI